MQAQLPAKKQSKALNRSSPSRLFTVNTQDDFVAALHTATFRPAARASSIRRNTPGRGSTSPELHNSHSNNQKQHEGASANQATMYSGDAIHCCRDDPKEIQQQAPIQQHLVAVRPYAEMPVRTV